MQPYTWTSTHRPSPRRRSSTPRSKPRSAIVSSRLSLSHSLSRSHDLPKSYFSFRRKTTYILEEEGFPENRHLGAAATPLRTQPSFCKFVTESPVVYHGRASGFAPCSYDIVFSVEDNEVSNCHDVKEMRAHFKFYAIKLGPDNVCPNPLIPFWDGKVRDCTSFAVLRSHVYFLGGVEYITVPEWSLRAIGDVCKLRVSPSGAKEWVRTSPMICPRYCPQPLVLGGKMYVCNSYRGGGILPPPHWGEVFNPANGKWELIPNPPNYPEKRIIIYAALQNPDRVIVAHRVAGDRNSAIFYAYNVQNRSWSMLMPAERNLHRLCQRYGRDAWLKEAVGVNDTLYWIRRPEDFRLRDDILFVAYDLNLDMWLEGHLKGPASFFMEDYSALPIFLHLGQQRFCLLQNAADNNDYVRALTVDVSHMPSETLSISVVWDQKYGMEPTRSGIRPSLAYCSIR
jgi:hypothetical protein